MHIFKRLPSYPHEKTIGDIHPSNFMKKRSKTTLKLILAAAFSLSFLPTQSEAQGFSFYGQNPFSFMELQDVQGLSNFFERTVSSYQTGIEGDVSFDEDF